MVDSRRFTDSFGAYLIACFSFLDGRRIQNAEAAIDQAAESLRTHVPSLSLFHRLSTRVHMPSHKGAAEGLSTLEDFLHRKGNRNFTLDCPCLYPCPSFCLCPCFVVVWRLKIFRGMISFLRTTRRHAGARFQSSVSNPGCEIPTMASLGVFRGVLLQAPVKLNLRIW